MSATDELVVAELWRCDQGTELHRAYGLDVPSGSMLGIAKRWAQTMNVSFVCPCSHILLRGAISAYQQPRWTRAARADGDDSLASTWNGAGFARSEDTRAPRSSFDEAFSYASTLTL